MDDVRPAGEASQPEKKVALLGFAESYKLAFDLPEDVEFWGLNELWKYMPKSSVTGQPRWHRWFEIHDADTLGVSKRDLDEGDQKRHIEWMVKDHGPDKTIYVQPQFADGRWPNAKAYPLERMVEQFGRYFTSTIGYMLALAIAEGYTWIGLYGIDLASDVEYKFQRANAEYLCGLARGMGRTVVVAEGAAILRSGHLYGYDKPLGEVGGLKDSITNHMTGLNKKHDEAIQTLNTLDGAIQECQNFLKMIEFKERGVPLKTY